MSSSLGDIGRALRERYPVTSALELEMDGVAIRVSSNSPVLIGKLEAYFGRHVAHTARASAIRITALEASPPEFAVPFQDWPAPPGKALSKEAFADTPSGRVVRKLRTAMQFVVSPTELIAVGPCLQHTNQVVNFIVSQHISQKRHAGWLVCHAAGVAADTAGALAIAARSGAGKSTLALRLMSSGLSYVSNDRLLLRRAAGAAEVAGVPKLPRVNPGTLLHNPDLADLLPMKRRRELLELDPSALWDLEEKHDVCVDSVYGPGQSRDRAPLAALVLLCWQRCAALPTRFAPVQLEQRRDLLALLIKPTGVFDIAVGGGSAASPAVNEPGARAYLEALADVRVLEVTGRVDFQRATRYFRELLELPQP